MKFIHRLLLLAMFLFSTAMTAVAQKEAADAARAAEQFANAKDFLELPDFIVHPLGYNGEWAFISGRRTKDEMVKRLTDYFTSIDSTFTKTSAGVYETAKNHYVTIGNDEFLFDCMVTFFGGGISIKYMLPDPKKYDEMKRYFGNVIDKSKSKSKSFRSARYCVGGGRVEIIGEKDKHKTFITVFYHL